MKLELSRHRAFLYDILTTHKKTIKKREKSIFLFDKRSINRLCPLTRVE